ncbi:MAG: AAA family ATPase [Candidatus Omnitrophica bacterium]|nr:AAA family ATPase [Candidatus Omnitrophota bacterium]
MKSYIEETWEKIFGSRKAKRIFVAATRQNVGKTTVSMGLIASLANKFNNIAFIKPVGQRYVTENGYKVDEDSVLIEKVFNFPISLHDMSPVAIERGFTERFIDGTETFNTEANIKDAFGRISENKDLIVIEGTGHAGVGSVFDMSNAAVARMLGSKVILVSPGGIGNAIDEIMLNKSVFDNQGVKLAGVVINKVLQSKYDKINKYIRMGLKRLDIEVLGVVPYLDVLDRPTLQDIREELDMHVLCGEDSLESQTKKILVGAMEVREAAQHLEDGCLVITPGDRNDLLNLLTKVHTARFNKTPKKILGVILSGALVPKRSVILALKKAGIPTLMSRFDTYDVASRVHDLTVKIKFRDKDKVKLAIETIQKYVDIERVIENLG